MRRADGFTLIEILVVLAILGVVLGVVLGRGPLRSRGLETRAAAGSLAYTLRAARAQAIDGDRSVSVAIDQDHHAFAIDGGARQTLAPDLAVSVQIPEPPPDPIHPPRPGQERIKLIRFSPDGSATGGRVILGTGRHRLGVTVEWLTGQVSVSDQPSVVGRQ